MGTVAGALDEFVTALIPSLSKNLAEQFNVFRVMHHGTHEKQLSNVFAWLLREDGTHHLGDGFQQIFLARINEDLPNDAGMPTSGYRVSQEVNTAGPDETEADIADIVLTRADASVVIENYESSDGHGHGYDRYLKHGATDRRRSVVVLLCLRRESHRQADGWENAVVVTYAELLERLRDEVRSKPAWRRTYPEQDFFLTQLVDNFVEGPVAASIEDRVAFVDAMCRTGESARYGYRPQDRAADEFADVVAQHAKSQFEQGRATLAQVKQGLRGFAETTLKAQINSTLTRGRISSVAVPFVGQWEWCVVLKRDDDEPEIFLEFGPTAVVENARAAVPVTDPDYTRVFVTRRARDHDGIDLIIQTSVGLAEVISGLSPDDTRLAVSASAVMRSD